MRGRSPPWRSPSPAPKASRTSSRAPSRSVAKARGSSCSSRRAPTARRAGRWRTPRSSTASTASLPPTPCPLRRTIPGASRSEMSCPRRFPSALRRPAPRRRSPRRSTFSAGRRAWPSCRRRTWRRSTARTGTPTRRRSAAPRRARTRCHSARTCRGIPISAAWTRRPSPTSPCRPSRAWWYPPPGTRRRRSSRTTPSWPTCRRRARTSRSGCSSTISRSDARTRCPPARAHPDTPARIRSRRRRCASPSIGPRASRPTAR